MAERILVTAASGALGKLVVDQLLKKVDAKNIAVTVRKAESGVPFSARGVTVHIADYNDPAALKKAVTGIDRVLLISSSDVGKRIAQHGNVIDTAKQAGVKWIAYTSILKADTTTMSLAEEHKATEQKIAESGLPHVFLRNGWYTENYTRAVGPTLAHGSVVGSAKDGKVSTAARADYAAAAVAVLTDPNLKSGTAYELAGDDAFTLTELAAEFAKASGKPVVYKDLPPVELEKMYESIGLPKLLAEHLADSDVGISKGLLFDSGKQLSKLIGRPTTPWRDTIAAAVKAG